MGGKRIRAIALWPTALPLCLTLVGVVAVAIVVAGAVPRRHLVRAMSVYGIEPSEGPIAGGTAVTIRGEAFPASGVDVRFGNAQATAVTVVSSREIRVTTPPYSNGYATVTVQAGRQSAVSEFLFVPPPLASIRLGDITTVAGIGIYLAEGRAARAAPIVVTGDVALDIHGNILIAEKDAYVIRLIDSAGIIRRFAGTGLPAPGGHKDEIGDGGPATQATLNWPTGVAVGPAGDVYVAEQFNHRVRKIDLLSGVITTIAGSGPVGLTGGAFAGDGGPATAARFNEPNQVAFDARGNLYVLDAANTRIRKISPDGIITTVAGTGERGFSGDGGPATQAQFDVGGNGDSGSLKSDRDGNLFLVDDNARRVRRIDAATGIITTVAGGGTRPEDGVPATTASIRPSGIALDGEGNLYVSDFKRVCRVDPSGIITTVYGGLTAGISPDGTPRETGMLTELSRMTHDPVGNRLLFFEVGTTRLRSVDLRTGILTTLAGIGPSTLGENGHAIAAHFRAAHSDLAVDSHGNLLFGSGGEEGRVRRLEADGTLRTIAGGGVAPEHSPPLERPALGTPVNASGIAVAPNDDIYFTEPHSVARITAGGTYQRIAGGSDYGYGGDGGPASLAMFDNPLTIAIDPDGNLFVNDWWNHCIRRIDAQTGIITRFAGKVPPHTPNMWVENRSSGDGGPALDAEFLGPEWIAIDQASNVYVSDACDVRMIDRQGIINTVLDSEQFNCLGAALANDSARRVYVHCFGGKILRIDAPNVATPIVGTGAYEFGFAGDGGPAELALTRDIRGMAIDARGNVYLNDAENRRIRAIREVAK